MKNSNAAYTPLNKMKDTTPTRLWLDSIALKEMEYALENGAVGVTCNPLIVMKVLEQELPLWKDRIHMLVRQHPCASEDELGWALVKAISEERSKLLLPIFERENGKNGRLSIQLDPRLYRDSDAMIRQAKEFAEIAPNIIVKIPATKAGIAAIEEVTYLGISINATVSFTLAQALAVAEAVERGLVRRERAGLDISRMGPVCTLMLGRLDDYHKELVSERDIEIDASYLEWGGVAVCKKAYACYVERGYRLRLLVAAFRNQLHWSEFLGADMVISPPYTWMREFNASDIEISSRIDTPVDPVCVLTLERLIPEYNLAYEADGLSLQEFDTYAPTRKTLSQFADGCHSLARLMRSFL